MKLNELNEAINRLLKSVDYSSKIKEEINKTLNENPKDIVLREQVLKVIKGKITEENKYLGKRKF